MAKVIELTWLVTSQIPIFINSTLKYSSIIKAGFKSSKQALVRFGSCEIQISVERRYDIRIPIWWLPD